MWSICRRDVIAAFTSPLAWLVLAAWLFLVNAVFALGLVAVHRSGGGADVPLFIAALSSGALFLILLAPAISMTSFTGERAQGTMQVLLTVPLREWELIGGKFAAVYGVLLALIAATLPQPLVLWFVSDVPIAHLCAGYAGLCLAAAAYAGIGIWISLLVDSPVSAYVITFAVLAVLAVLGLLAEHDVLSGVGRAFGIQPRLASFLRGQLALGDVLYFVGLAGGALVLAHGTLLARRVHG